MAEKPELDPKYSKIFRNFWLFSFLKFFLSVAAQVEALLQVLNPDDFDLPSGNSDPEVQKVEFRQFLEARIVQNHEVSGCHHDLTTIHQQNWAGASETTKYFNLFRKYHQFES